MAVGGEGAVTSSPKRRSSRGLARRTAGTSLVFALLTALVGTACEPVPSGSSKFGFSDQRLENWDAGAAGQFASLPTEKPFATRWARRIIWPCKDDLADIQAWAKKVREQGLEPIVTPEWDVGRRGGCEKLPGDSNETIQKVAYWYDIMGWTRALRDGPGKVRYWTSINEPTNESVTNHEIPGNQGPKIISSSSDPNHRANLAWQWVIQRNEMWLACKDCELITGEFNFRSRTTSGGAELMPNDLEYLLGFAAQIKSIIVWFQRDYPNEGWTFPMRWSFHDYGDVSRLDEPEKQTLNAYFGAVGMMLVWYAEKGAGIVPNIWITEAGVLQRIGDDVYPPFANRAKQVQAAQRFLALGADPRVDRLFYYSWSPGSFDAGLTDQQGRPRVAYCVLKGLDPDGGACPGL